MDVMDIYEDAEFIEFLEKRYTAILNIVKKVVEKVFGNLPVDQQIQLVSALISSHPPVYIKEDYLRLKAKAEIGLTDEKIREVLGEDFELFTYKIIGSRRTLIPKKFLGDKWGEIADKLRLLGFKWDKELGAFTEAF